MSGRFSSGVVPAVAVPSDRPSGPGLAKRGFALLVDDDDASLRTFTRLLSKHPVEVLVASNPSQALGLVSMLEPNKQPIVAFLDVLMPGMDGPRFVHSLRSFPAFGAAPVVLVSALSNAALEKAALEWGASGIIQKASGLIQVDREFGGWIDRVITR